MSVCYVSSISASCILRDVAPASCVTSRISVSLTFFAFLPLEPDVLFDSEVISTVQRQNQMYSWQNADLLRGGGKQSPRSGNFGLIMPILSYWAPPTYTHPKVVDLVYNHVASMVDFQKHDFKIVFFI